LNYASHGTAGVRIFTNLLEKPEQRIFNDLLLFENVLFLFKWRVDPKAVVIETSMNWFGQFVGRHSRGIK
jgi:hypothetical protein